MAHRLLNARGGVLDSRASWGRPIVLDATQRRSLGDARWGTLELPQVVAAWWQPPAYAAYRFGRTLGVALAVHYVRLLIEAAPLWTTGALALEPAAGVDRLQVNPGWVTSLCVLAVAASVCLAVGRASRLCAATLFGTGVLMQRALAPIARLDDWFAVLAPSWLLIVARPRLDRRPSWAPVLLMGHILIAYGWTRWFALLSPDWLPTRGSLIALCAVPAPYAALWLVRPEGADTTHWTVRAASWFPPAYQLGVHTWIGIASGEWLTHAVLASSAWWMRPSVIENPGHLATERPVFDLGSVAAMTFTGLLATAILGAGPPQSRAAQVLHHVGLMPMRSAVTARSTVLVIEDEVGRQSLARWDGGELHGDSVRARLLRAYVTHRGPLPSRGRRVAKETLRALANAHCARPKPWTSHSGITHRVREESVVPRPPLATFVCANGRAHVNLGGLQ